MSGLWNGVRVSCLQWHVIGQVFDSEVLVLNFHRRPAMNLHGQHAFQDSAGFVEVDQVCGLVSVDPVLVMISFDQNTEVVPLVGGKFFHRHLTDNPWLSGPGR